MSGPIRLEHVGKVRCCTDSNGRVGESRERGKAQYSQHYWECFTVTMESLSQAVTVTVRRHSYWRIKKGDTHYRLSL